MNPFTFQFLDKKTTSPIKRAVIEWLKRELPRYRGNLERAIENSIKTNHFFQSRTLPSFYTKYKTEIWEQIVIDADNQGYKNPFDFLATLRGGEYIETSAHFETLLANYAFKEEIRLIASELEIEID